ncbi:kinesin-like protein KIF19 [Rana temporaria]|uniref:kinesin-like protein KIF19 n=1 Tax=Rana temporaria TaxID=8407 RepID=UPI001AAD6715|nr:kinesin-like protein KIF19 [Rana temporaria]
MNIKEDFQYHQITVALRIRPFNQVEIERGVECITYKLSEQILLLKDPSGGSEDFLRAKRSRDRTFVFDAVFDQDATQEQVYESTTKNLVDGIVRGYNATVFAYGPTGTGKTYTMLGMDRESGIYIQALNDLFKAIEDNRESMECSVSLSYLEIYNETIRDLLNPSGVLDLRDDSKGIIQISGITEFCPSSAEEAMALVQRGNKHRTQEPTAANKTSSRSHAILQVVVKKNSKLGTPDEARIGKLLLIDLAGSERASQTQNRGRRMKEGAHINRSLLALGNCITALSERGSHTHVNYRDSKLTRLLKDALSGNSRTVMIAHVSPSIAAYDESRTTLIYASRTKNIKTRVRQNYENAAQHATKYGRVLYNLHNELEKLHQRINEHGREIRRLMKTEVKIRSPQEDADQAEDSHKEHKLINLVKQFQCVLEEHMKVKCCLLQLDNSHLEQHIDTVRHLATIADWEQDRPQCYTQQRSGKTAVDTIDVGEEEEDGDSDITEPHEVMMAREEINILLAEQQKTSAKMTTLKEQWANSKFKASQLEKQIPDEFSSDQGELFRLLHKIHELQVSNSELLTRSICKDSLLYQKDFVILGHQHYRSLCEKIIHLQQTLIDEKVHDPELLHLHEIDYVKIKQTEEQKSLLLNRFKHDILENGVEPETFGGVHLHLDIEQIDRAITDNRKNNETHTRLTLSLSPDLDSGYRTCKSTPGLIPTRQNSSLSLLTPFHHLRAPTQADSNEIIIIDPPKEETPTRLHSHPLDDSQRHSLSFLQLSPDILEEVVAGTRSISLVAARRRSRVNETESPYIIKERSALSSLPVLEGNALELPVTHSRCHITPVRKAVSTENLPSLVLRKDEVTSGTTSASSKDKLQKKSYWDRKSHSFEVPASQLCKSEQCNSHRIHLDKLLHSKSPHTICHGKSAHSTTKVKTAFNYKTIVRPKLNKNYPCTITSGTQPKLVCAAKSDPEEIPASTKTLILPQNIKHRPQPTYKKTRDNKR